MHNIYSGPEKRRHARVTASFVVVCQADKPLEKGSVLIKNQPFDAIMLDLSESGMAISLSHHLPPLTRIYLDFTLVNIRADENDRVKPMRLTGEVRYCNCFGRGEYRIGVLFKRISKKNKAAIADFVKKKN